MLINIFGYLFALLCLATLSLAAPPPEVYAPVNVTSVPAVASRSVIKHRVHQTPLHDIVRISSVLSPVVSKNVSFQVGSHVLAAKELKMNNTQVVKIRQFRRRTPQNSFNVEKGENNKDIVNKVQNEETKNKSNDGWGDKTFMNKIGLAPPELENFQSEDQKSMLNETQIEAVLRSTEASSILSPLLNELNPDLRPLQPADHSAPTLLSDKSYDLPPLSSALPMDHFDSQSLSTLTKNDKLQAFIEYQNAQQEEKENANTNSDGVSDEDILKRYRLGQDYTLERLPKAYQSNSFNDRAIYGPDLGAPAYSDSRISYNGENIGTQENDDVVKFSTNDATKQVNMQQRQEKAIVDDDDNKNNSHNQNNYGSEDYLREQIPVESIRSNSVPEIYPQKQHVRTTEVVDNSYVSSALSYHNDYSFGYQGRMWRDFPSFSSVPKTSFTCPGYGFFADIETGCQVWHYCQPDGRHDSFLCANGTLFNQATRVCDWWHRVDCFGSTMSHFGNNVDLYRMTEYYGTNIDHYQRMPAASGVHQKVVTTTSPIALTTAPVQYTKQNKYSVTEPVPLVNYAGEVNRADNVETSDNTKVYDNASGGHLYKVFDLRSKKK